VTSSFVSAAVVEFLLSILNGRQAARRMVKDAEQRLMADEGLQNKPHLDAAPGLRRCL
jgi:hypothetical protein